jgi:hypothetical protein
LRLRTRLADKDEDADYSIAHEGDKASFVRRKLSRVSGFNERHKSGHRIAQNGCIQEVVMQHGFFMEERFNYKSACLWRM